MRNISLFKEEYKGFTICDQGYTILNSASNQTLHAPMCWSWCHVVLAVAWNAIGLLGLFFGLWYNRPAVAAASFVSLGVMMWVYHPKKKKPLPIAGRGPVAVKRARIRRARASATSRAKSPSPRSERKKPRSSSRSSEASDSGRPAVPQTPAD